MGSTQSNHLNNILSSPQAYNQYYSFIYHLVDSQDIPAIERTIDKIQETLKNPETSSQSKFLAVQLARQLITTGSYTYFILLSTRVLPLLVYSAEFKKQLGEGDRGRRLFVQEITNTVSNINKQNAGVHTLRMILETIMAVAIWLPINPYQSQAFPSLFRMEYERMVYDDIIFPEQFAYVRDYEPEKCKESYMIKVPQRLQYAERLAAYIKGKFKKYLSKGEPLEYRRLAMNILWTGDNYFCTYLVERCCKIISNATATEFKRMNALDFLEDMFGIADVQCLEQIKAKAVPCMLQYIFPIDFKQNRHLPSPKFINSNLRNRCIQLLAVWTKRMRQFPIINRSLYEIIYEKTSHFQYITDPIKLERQHDVTHIMEQNIKYRRNINEMKMTSYLISPEIDICANLIKGYIHTTIPTQASIHTDSYFLPMNQVMSLKPQSLPSVTGESYIPLAMTSSRVLMQFPSPEHRTSKTVINNIHSGGSSQVVMPYSQELKLINNNQISHMGRRSQSATTHIIPSNTISSSIRHVAISNTIAGPVSLLQIPSQPKPQSSKHLLITPNNKQHRHPSTLSPIHSISIVRPVSSNVGQSVQHSSQLIIMRPPSRIYSNHVIQANDLVKTSIYAPNLHTQMNAQQTAPLTQRSIIRNVIESTSNVNNSVGQQHMSLHKGMQPITPAVIASPPQNSRSNSFTFNLFTNNSVHAYNTSPSLSNNLAIKTHQQQTTPFITINDQNMKSLQSQAVGTVGAIGEQQNIEEIQLNSTIRGQPSPLNKTIALDEKNMEHMSQQMSHFRVLQPLNSDKTIFNGSYSQHVKSLLAVSAVESNPSSAIDEYVNEDVSDVYQTVIKPMFAFDKIKSWKIITQQHQSLEYGQEHKLSGNIRSAEKVRPCTPLSAHMNKIKQTLASPLNENDPATFYGINSQKPASGSLPSQIRTEYENKILILEEELKQRMERQSQYETEIGKLANAIKRNNLRKDERVIQGVGVINNHNEYSDKTKLKGYNYKQRQLLEERASSSHEVIATINKPLHYREANRKIFLLKSKSLILKTLNIEVGYVWQSSISHPTLLMCYKFYRHSAQNFSVGFESASILMQQQPTLKNKIMQPDEQLKQQVKMKLTDIQNFRRPVVNLSYRQHKQFYKESIELPVTLFRFFQNQSVESEGFKALFQEHKSDMHYTKTLNHPDTLFTSPEALKQLIPYLTRISSANSKQTVKPAIYGVKVGFNQQEIMMRISHYSNNSITIDVLPKKGSNKLASVYLDNLAELLKNQ